MQRCQPTNTAKGNKESLRGFMLSGQGTHCVLSLVASLQSTLTTEQKRKSVSKLQREKMLER